MMLVIWCRDKKERVKILLKPALAQSPAVPVYFIEDRKELFLIKDEVVLLALGTDLKTILEEEKIIPKGRTVGKLRNHVYPSPMGPLMLSYSPGISEIDYGGYVDLLNDVGSACRYAQHKTLEPQLGIYTYVENFKADIAWVQQEYADTGKPVECFLDLETIGLDPYRLPGINHPGAYIVSIQLTVEVGRASVRYFHNRMEEENTLNDIEFLQDLAFILNSPFISLGGANLKFDTHWLHVRARLQCSNFKFDTTLVGSLLDENRSNGLDVHAKIYAHGIAGYSDSFDRKIDKSRMDLVPKAELLSYAGGDTDAGLQVRKAMKEELLKDAELTRFYVNILHPASRAFEQIEQGGILVDMQQFDLLEADLNTEIIRLTKEVKPLLGGRLVAKHGDITRPGGLNLTKASLLSDFMFSTSGLNLKPQMLTEKTGQPSTAMEHLLMFEDVPEAKAFVGLLKEFSSATKTLGTYVEGFRSHIRSDGRMHPSYYFFAGMKGESEGTTTGRLSARDPAIQTLPKHTKWSKRLRACYIAPKGYLILENDYSQGELKVIACLANEEAMIESYRAGLDLHVTTSARFAGYSYEEMMAMKKADTHAFDEIRQLGKAGNFGLIYGMGADGFGIYAKSNYGVTLTPEQANAFRDGFFASYPALPRYHKHYKGLAKKHGYVRSPLGRRRNLPLINSGRSDVRSAAERQSINAPVQSTLSDMLLWAISESHKRGWFETCPAIAAVHDAKYTYIPEDNASMYIERELEVMENLPFHEVGWKPQLRFTADAKVGKNLAELKGYTRK